jgi:hypothetical protein
LTSASLVRCVEQPAYPDAHTAPSE